MKGNLLRDFAKRVKEKVALLSGYGPPMIVEAWSEEEAERLSAEYVERWGPDADFVLIIWASEAAEPALVDGGAAVSVHLL